MQPEKIINRIRQSRAFWNDCFEQSFRCPIGLPATKLKALATNWHAVTRHFARTLPNLITVICKQHELETKQAETDRLEILGRETLKILGNDWGLGIKKFDGTDDNKVIHFKLFERVPQKLGFSKKLEPETLQLMEDLSSGFSNSVEDGFGKLLAVEYTASNILRIGDSFARAVNDQNEKFFTGNDLIYFPMHEDLEKVHADDTESLISLVGNTIDREDMLTHSVDISIRKFADFWQKMALITFNERQ